jgi:exodeoxyribonuclease VII large subunit
VEHRDMSETTPQVLTVSQLTSRVKDVLEGEFPEVWVGGEISDLSQSHAGHIYFTLKDAKSQIRGVIWASTAARLKFRLQDGLAVTCRGGVEVYAPRGTYQLIVRQIEPQGEGALQLAFRQLHAKLAQEGLFDARHKQPLPAFPSHVAFVTSPTGAAIRDFLEVVKRRWPGLHVTVVPAKVQGAGATDDLVRGIALAHRLAPAPDVLVVGRGGGSLEDLWSFNEEPLVRAVHGSRIPVVSAVGHEIDVTLCDLAADVRALTPTEAGELVTPSRDELLADLRQARDRLAAALRRRAASARQRLQSLADRRCFRRPFDAIYEWRRRLDELDARADVAIRRRMERARERLQFDAQRLEALSPLAVLTRGYSVTSRERDGLVLVDAAAVEVGEVLVTRLGRGLAWSRVIRVEEEQKSAVAESRDQHALQEVGREAEGPEAGGTALPESGQKKSAKRRTDS